MNCPHSLSVKSVDGRLVINPATGKPIGPEAVLVPRTPFWLSRLRDGDVAEADMLVKTEIVASNLRKSKSQGEGK